MYLNKVIMAYPYTKINTFTDYIVGCLVSSSLFFLLIVRFSDFFFFLISTTFATWYYKSMRARPRML